MVPVLEKVRLILNELASYINLKAVLLIIMPKNHIFFLLNVSHFWLMSSLCHYSPEVLPMYFPLHLLNFIYCLISFNFINCVYSKKGTWNFILPWSVFSSISLYITNNAFYFISKRKILAAPCWNSYPLK